MNSHIERRALELSKLDPLGLAREILGEQNPRATGALGFIFAQEQAFVTEKLWQEIGDTYRRMPWEKFIELITSNGFSIVKQWQFPYKTELEMNSPVKEPEAVIAVDKKRKLLLNATSYFSSTGEVLNGGEIHGAVKLEDKDWISVNKNVQASCRYDNNAWQFDMDILEGMFTRLRLIDKAGAKFVKWQARNHVIDLGDYRNIGVEELLWKEDVRKRRREIKQLLTSYPDARAFIR